VEVTKRSIAPYGPSTFGENPYNPVNRRLFWLNMWFGLCRKEKISFLCWKWCK
jgi:hypothetical protein